MDTVSNGCFIEQDFLIADEYGEEVTCTEWIPQLAPTSSGSAALPDHHASDQDRSSFPYVDLPRAPVKTTAFPKCP